MTARAHTLTFMGTGASCGVPSYYCGCAACEEARVNPKAARNCSGLLISGVQQTLIDAAPELRQQLVRERVSVIDQALFTHEHFDHIGGIPQLEYYVKLKSRRPLPVYANAHTLRAIDQQFAFMADSLEPHLFEPGQTLQFDDVRYTALPAAHSPEAFGFLIQAGEKTVAYLPDTGPLPEGTRAALCDLDILIIDATFNGSNWMPAAHHSIDSAIALAQSLGVRKTYLTHLSMHYDTPITLAELEQRLAPYAGTIEVASDGLRIEL